jgi:hypothetical protein
MGLKEVWLEFEKGVKDLSTLDVVTLSGSIDLTSGQGTSPNLELSKLPELISNAIKGGATKVNVKVVAFTHVEGDLDTTHFVETDANASLLEAHKEIVKTAHDARNSFLRMLKELVVGLG